MSEPIRITLEADGFTAALNSQAADGAVWAETIAGWYGTPEPKVDLVERVSGDGAHAVPDEAVLYAARVVTIGAVASGAGRDAVNALMESVNVLAHRNVRIAVADGGGETWAEGYLSTSWAENAYPGHQRGEITVVCTDPRRYGAARMAYIVPDGDGGGGLLYDEGAGYILLPIEFYGEAPSANAATVSNSGTSAAHPAIIVRGDFPDGVTINHGGGQLAYPAPIGAGAPLVLDGLTRTATVRGVDVTRALTSRDFPAIPPGGSVTLSVLASGTGTVTVESFDTYI